MPSATDRSATPSGRLVSLDAFRGATIALMVLVNTAGDGQHVYAPLRHAEWNGWTPTDVVFPSFMCHNVNAVKTGVRYSLVSWVSGPQFR